MLNAETESHLLNLHAYLQKNFYYRKGIHIIRTELLKRCNLQKSYRCSLIKEEKICPRCFCYWSEGNFTIKFKPKKIFKDKNKDVKKKWKKYVIKCLVCFKYVTLFYLSSKNKNITLKEFQPKKKHSIPIDKKKVLRNEKIHHPSKKKKSMLTFLNELISFN